MVREPDAIMESAPQDDQLMSEHRILRFKPALRLEWRGQDGQNETEQPNHSASLGDSITSSTRIRFSVHTPTFVDYDTVASANRATTNVGGMTTIPSFRNCHAVTASPSRLRAISHRIVASEPVTERLGPRSTPINIPLVTCRGTSAFWLTVAATKPAGRLFIRFEARATMMPAPNEASRGEYAATS